jgi:hypothetical protein
MNIKFNLPVFNSTHLKRCEFYLAQHKPTSLSHELGKLYLVMLLDIEMLFIDEEGVCSWADADYFDTNYDIIAKVTDQVRIEVG